MIRTSTGDGDSPSNSDGDGRVVARSEQVTQDWLWSGADEVGSDESSDDERRRVHCRQRRKSE